MKYALVIYQQPGDKEADKQGAWIKVTSVDASMKAGAEGTTKLNEGAYLCSLEGGLKSLRTIVGHAEDQRISTRTLFFDQEPPFVSS